MPNDHKCMWYIKKQSKITYQVIGIEIPPLTCLLHYKKQRTMGKIQEHNCNHRLWVKPKKKKSAIPSKCLSQIDEKLISTLATDITEALAAKLSKQ